MLTRRSKARSSGLRLHDAGTLERILLDERSDVLRRMLRDEVKRHFKSKMAPAALSRSRAIRGQAAGRESLPQQIRGDGEIFPVIGNVQAPGDHQRRPPQLILGI
jgi:hypothetical protein